MVQILLTWFFYLIFFITPLIFTPLNNELFEYNKMMVVYFGTVLVVGFWVLKMVNQRKLILKKTPLDIPIGLFFLSQVLSTLFSIDPHTSWWGYYSRSNGGLYSVISYLLLFYALVSNFDFNQIIKFLKVSLLSGFLVALYAIPEHFGVSPSCIILIGDATANCWVQDVQARVFATLGQPNWLGAYLGMIIFPAMYFYLTAKKTLGKIFYGVMTIAMYMAFTFTFSRGATLGLLAGIGVFVIFYFNLVEKVLFYGGNLLSKRFDLPIFKKRVELEQISYEKSSIKLLAILLGGFLVVNLLYGSALTRFQLITQSPPPPRPGGGGAVTQLEAGGTESGQIRLIVWKGALEIFNKYPLFGSGLETFAYSYYNHRPVEHNLVSEWDFLYNKAHNEYLNYLATTGIFGLATYLAMVLAFIIFCVGTILGLKFKVKNYEFNFEIEQNKQTNDKKLLLITLLAAYLSFLVQNIFGFSVVIIALLFYLIPGFSFVSVNKLKDAKLPNFITQIVDKYFLNIIYKRELYLKIVQLLIVCLVIFNLTTLFRFWMADTRFKLGSDYNDEGSAGRAYNFLLQAVRLNDGEPLYKSELGYAAAAAYSALESMDNKTEEEASTAARLKDQAVLQTELALNESPENVSLWRTAIRTYFQISTIDPSFQNKTLQVVDETIKRAPTDAKLYYNKALILSQYDKDQEAIQVLEKAVEIKPNYREARLSLANLYAKQELYQKAKEQLEIVLQMIPNDPDASKQLEDLQGKL